MKKYSNSNLMEHWEKTEMFVLKSEITVKKIPSKEKYMQLIFIKESSDIISSILLDNRNRNCSILKLFLLKGIFNHHPYKYQEKVKMLHIFKWGSFLNNWL